MENIATMKKTMDKEAPLISQNSLKTVFIILHMHLAQESGKILL